MFLGSWVLLVLLLFFFLLLFNSSSHSWFISGVKHKHASLISWFRGIRLTGECNKANNRKVGSVVAAAAEWQRPPNIWPPGEQLIFAVDERWKKGAQEVFEIKKKISLKENGTLFLIFQCKSVNNWRSGLLSLPPQWRWRWWHSYRRRFSGSKLKVGKPGFIDSYKTKMTWVSLLAHIQIISKYWPANMFDDFFWIMWLS